LQQKIKKEKMNRYHKWTIKDGDYVRKEEDIHIARPESLFRQIKKRSFSIIWKITIISLLAFLFLKMI
jgi:hypothetical protein